MVAPFVPLTPKSPLFAQVTSLTQKAADPQSPASDAQPVKNLSFTPIEQTANRPGSASTEKVPHACASNSPSVTVQRDGDHISQIRIECACGQVIELECLY